MKSAFIFFWEIIKIVVIALLIVIPIRTFIFQPFFVRGQSMEPSFENGDYLIIDEISYRFKNPQRGEVVVFKYPYDPSQRYIKRIVGLPSETIKIENGEVLVLNEKGWDVLDESAYLSFGLKTPGNIQISLLDNEYFVLGDNRSASADSRRWGALPSDKIIGRVIVRAWPITAFAKFEAPGYEF